ncbi:callose synthase 9 isoform X3 [Physcomitrium patens]|nr:callose synthase 9-like isoform X3 [Physcomitrium patens]|eukprot:XP_024386165.1 callose synthase 9-like isoform X3 [Physcomitrella patens]
MAYEICAEGTDSLSKNGFRQKSIILRDSDSFLDAIIKPIHEIVAAEAKVCNHGKSPHSRWRNYDDFNEYFWAPFCFELGWPWRLNSGFFVKPKQITNKKTSKFKSREAQDQVPLLLDRDQRSEPSQRRERKAGKSHFVEHRSGLHLYHSFHRLWIFLVCMLQGLAIFAFCDAKLNSVSIKYILSVGPTFVAMKFLQSVLDVILMIGAYRSTRARTLSRIWLRLIWFASLSAAIIILFVKTIQEQDSGSNSSTWFRLYCILLIIYGGSQLFVALLLNMPWLRRLTEKYFNFGPLSFLNWVHQERYYVGRGMYESTGDYLSYILFWLLVLACKFSFSYFLQINTMVKPTRAIIDIKNIDYRWRDIFSKSHHNALTLVSLWAPVVMIYFLDLQIWYTVISALVGGLNGARIGLGEIRSLHMLRTHFSSLPSAFTKRLQPNQPHQEFMAMRESADMRKPKLDARRFAPIWNEVIISLREEDLISNKERDLLVMPLNISTPLTTSSQPLTLIQWPLFLLANKVYVACDMAEVHKQANQDDLCEKIGKDPYMMFAVQEAFYVLRIILEYLLMNDQGALWVTKVYEGLEQAMHVRQLRNKFNLRKSQLRKLLDKAAGLTTVVIRESKKIDDLVKEGALDDKMKKEYTESLRKELLDFYDVVMRDFIADSELRNDAEGNYELQTAKQSGRLFSDLALPTEESKALVERLHSILTFKESALNVPENLEARRRLEFFSNSLFMRMPNAPSVRKMLSFSVFTPYYSEDVIYSPQQLAKENDDGISMMYYLRTIVPDEWNNFLERVYPKKEDREAKKALLKTIFPKEFKFKENEQPRKPEDLNEDVKLKLRLWASYRGQTLARTVRGMMYYKRALVLQSQQEGATVSAEDLEQGRQYLTSAASQVPGVLNARAQAELKFLYVVSAQIYGEQNQGDKGAEGRQKAADISYLMKTFDSLRISYIHKAKVKTEGKEVTEYYSKLMKADPSGNDQEIYSIKLPGEVILGEGKPENQNHAIIFTRGEALQTIDMNQEHYLEETFKMRNLLEEFNESRRYGHRNPTILGVREHVFTGSVSSLAWFMSLQERSFVTLGQRVLANPLKVRMHYGHPDVFDRIFHITRGGISKASKQINLSEDIFAGFNSTLRLGNVTHHEYIQCGKGRDVGLNQIAAFEGKVASGNGEQTLSRDIYRLGQLFDFFRMLSFFFTTVGYYFTTMLTVLTVYVFLYGKVYLALSGVDQNLKDQGLSTNVALQSALDTQFLLQIGVFTAVPMIMNFVLEEGILKAIISFLTMQLQLSSVFFTFSLGTRTHYFGRTILHGGAKYASTGRGFVVAHIPFAENYRMYSRSHFVKALEIMLLLIVYLAYGASERTTLTYVLLTFSSWFLAISWLWAPYIFNPSGFEWQKTVADFDDWTNWLFHKGGIGDEGKKSWEVWWLEEQAHIQTPRGRFWEIVLSLRFFLVQYGVIYALNVVGHDKGFRVYGFSWCVLVGIVLTFKVFSMNQKSWANFQLFLRLFQMTVFLAIIGGVIVAVAMTALTIGDVFACALSLIPTGWGLISIAIAIRPVMKRLGLWKSIRAIARLYEAFMGAIVFIPIAILSWFPFVSTFQTRLVFNQAFSRGLEISTLLAGNNPNSNM